MQKKLLALLSDAAVYGLTSVLSQVITFFLLPLYTSYLGPGDYGIVAMLALTSAVYQPLANLGLSSAIFRRFNTTKDEGERQLVLSSALFAVLGTSTLLFATAAVASRPLTDVLLGPEVGVELVLVTLATAFLTSLNTVPQAVLRAERRVRTAGLLGIVEVTATILATIALVVGAEVGVIGVLFGSLAGEVLLCAGLFAATFRSFRFEASRRVLRGMLSYGLPLVPHQLQGVGLAYVSQYMLKEKVGLVDAGLFNMAQKFALPVSVVVNAIQRAWDPYKFHIHATDADPKPFFRTSFTYYVAAVCYLWLGVSVWGPELLRFMMDERFHDAARLIPATATIPLVFGIRGMLSTGRELTDKTGAVPVISFVGLVLVTTSSFVLIPPFGALGAAASTTLGWIVMAYGNYWFAQRVFPIGHQWPLVFGFLGLAIAVVGGVHAIGPGQSVLVRLGLALAASVVYPVLAGLVLARSAEDRARLRNVWGAVRAKGLAKLGRGRRPGDTPARSG